MFIIIHIILVGKELAKKYGCQFVETSAKQGIRIDDAFYGIVREIRRLNQEKIKNQQFNVDRDKEGLFMDSCGCILM